MKPRLVVAAAAFVACGAHAQQSVILVRHAELDTTPGVEAKKVPLSSEGEARAQRLAKLLERSGIAAVYATDFLRTHATAEPSAGVLKREVIVESQNDPKQFVARLHKEHEGQAVLVVGHTDTVPGIIKALGVAEPVKIEKEDFGNVFIVTPRSDSPSTLVRLRY